MDEDLITSLYDLTFVYTTLRLYIPAFIGHQLHPSLKATSADPDRPQFDGRLSSNPIK